MKLLWKNTENIVAILSPIVSVIAIIVSIQSNIISKHAQILAESEYASQRQLIIRAKFHNETQDAVFEPVDPGMVLQGMRIHYPPDLIAKPWPIDLNSLSVSTLVIGSEIERRYKNQDTADDDKVITIREAALPIVLESHYSARGSAFHDISLYALHYQSIPTRSSIPGDTIKFTALAFLGRLYQDDEIAIVLNQNLKAVEAQLNRDKK